MKEEFFHRQPPKSTGREVCGDCITMFKLFISVSEFLQCYGKEYIDKLLAKCEELKLSQEDVVATVTG